MITAEEWETRRYQIITDLLADAPEDFGDGDAMYAAHLIADREMAEQFGERPAEEQG